MFYSHNSCLDAVDTIEDGPSTVCLCPAEATPTTSAYLLYTNSFLCRRVIVGLKSYLDGVILSFILQNEWRSMVLSMVIVTISNYLASLAPIPSLAGLSVRCEQIFDVPSKTHK